MGRITTSYPIDIRKYSNNTALNVIKNCFDVCTKIRRLNCNPNCLIK